MAQPVVIWFVVLYIAASIGIGLHAALRVHDTRDCAVAVRSLPFYVVIASVFAPNSGSSIYEMGGNAYKVTLVGALGPLVAGSLAPRVRSRVVAHPAHRGL